MNAKILCRIVSNTYNVYDQGCPLNDEIDLLRRGKKTNNLILNNLYKIHKEIIQKKGKINFIKLITNIKKSFNNQYCYNERFINSLKKLYYKNKIIDLSKNIISLNIMSGDVKFKYIFLEIVLNTIQYRLTNEMFVYHPGVLYLFNDVKNHKEIINSAKVETMYYLSEKRIFTINEIRNNINSFFLENESFSKYIKHVYLFGSYAKGKNDNLSDVDLFFEITNKEDVNFIPLSYLLKKCMKEKYEMYIDVLIHYENKNYDQFEKKIMSYAIRLI